MFDNNVEFYAAIHETAPITNRSNAVHLSILCGYSEDYLMNDIIMRLYISTPASKLLFLWGTGAIVKHYIKFARILWSFRSRYVGV